jgi:UDP-N-acetylmuramyl pentapeptide synthase
MRLSLQRLGDPRQPITIINDAYNANPQSVAAALDTLMRWPLPAASEGRRVLVFADMLELGDTAKDMHRDVGRRIGEATAADGRGIDLTILIGELAMWTGEALAARFPNASVYACSAWTDDLPAELAALLRPNDIVLLKGSRGMQLERLVPAIEARVTQPAEAA